MPTSFIHASQPGSLAAQAVDIGLDPAVHLMTCGGDERIVLDAETGLNRYLTAPHSADLVAYSSSTANFISVPALAEVTRKLARVAPQGTLSAARYGEELEALRTRLRTTWWLAPSTQIVFAASGTDLEYVGLALAQRSGLSGVDNILIGADEVGSGCPHAASGQHFAKTTPLARAVEPGVLIDPQLEGKAHLAKVPVRDFAGEPLLSEDIMLAISSAIEAALAAGRHPLVHVVHGSKTGLILPSLAHIDALQRRFGNRVSFVVDACQSRIPRQAVAEYLARDMSVFLTGSKFAGGPPFSGMALVPASAADCVDAALPGLATIFCRAEWPAKWPGHATLPDQANLGLLLRLEAAVFEMEGFHRLHPIEIRRIVHDFEQAVNSLAERLGVRRVSGAPSEWQASAEPPSIESRTLATLDLRGLGDYADYEWSRTLYTALSQPGPDGAPPIRTGQPVRCVPMTDGRFGGTLRISLSMPQMVAFAELDGVALREKLAADMAAIAHRVETFLASQRRSP